MSNDNELFVKTWNKIFLGLSEKTQMAVELCIQRSFDDQGRYEFFKDILNAIKFEYSLKYPKKCLKKAYRAYTMGTKMIDERKFHESLMFFTRCLAENPLNYNISTKILCGDVLLQRATALRNLGLMNDALMDLELAEMTNPPIDIGLHIAYNKYVCLKSIGREKLARQAWIQTNLLASTIHSTPHFREIVGTFDRHIMRNDEGCLIPPIQPPPQLSYGSNEELPCASSKVALCHDQKYGRHLAAAKDINPGDIILVEEAVAFSVNPCDKLLFCHHCLKRSHGPVPCNNCSQVVYCSRECLEDAFQKYHKQECEMLSWVAQTSFLEFDPIVIKLLFTIGIDKLKSFKETNIVDANFGNPRTRGFTNSKFNPSTIEAIYSLVTNGLYRSQRDYCARSFLAAFIVKCMEFSKIDGGDSIGGIILHLLQIIHCNCIQISQYCKKNVGSEYHLKIGTGLFPTAALLNHSCDPNLFHNFHGTTIVVRAIRFIPKGEQLFINYGVDCLKQSATARFEFLKARYFFKCECLMCEEDYHVNYLGLPSVNLTLNSQKKQRIKKSFSELCRGLAFKEKHPAKLRVTSRNIAAVFSHLQLLEKYGMKANMDYFLIMSAVKDYYCAQGNSLTCV